MGHISAQSDFLANGLGFGWQVNASVFALRLISFSDVGVPIQNPDSSGAHPDFTEIPFPFKVRPMNVARIRNPWPCRGYFLRFFVFQMFHVVRTIM